MASKARKSAVASAWLVAVIEFAHTDLKFDAAGRLVELPGLLDAVDSFLAALGALVSGSIECDLRPYSTAGWYGFEMRIQSESRTLELGDGDDETDPFHFLVARLWTAWQKVEANAKSESPQQLKDIGVSNREFRTLKSLGKFNGLKVNPRLRTEDGRNSELPSVDPELLGKIKSPDPEDQAINSLVTGVMYTTDGTVMLHLEFLRWVRAPFVSLAEVGAQFGNRARAVGILKCPDGAYEFQGDSLVVVPKNGTLPFPHGQAGED